MDPIEKLKAAIAELLSKQTAILDEADAKSAGVLSAEQRTEFDKLQAEKEAKETELAAAEKDLERKQQLKADQKKYGQGQGRKAPEAGVEVKSLKDHSEDDPKRGFKTPREFMLGVVKATKEGRIEDPRLRRLAALAAGSDEHGAYSDPHGGFVVPVGFSPDVMSTMADADPMAGRVTDVPMDSPSVNVPARVDKNHSSSVSGGLTVSRREETGSATSSRLEMEKITLKADSLFGMAYATEELLTDSAITFIALIEAGFREEFAGHLINERLNGSGVGEYLGVMNSGCLVSIAKEGSQAADTINGTNILKMRARCWRYSNAIWLANQDTYVQLVSAHIAGTNGDVFLFNPSRGEDAPDMLLGRPIIFAEWAQTLGDKGDIVLGNWSQFLEGTYQPLQQAESVHVRFVEHERAMKFWVRNAGAPWWRSALTPKNSSTTLSPFVTLDARA
jgi:HK97 family phage major capsid protein